MKRHFKTLAMVVTCMALALCVSCKKDNNEPTAGGTAVLGDSDGSFFGHEYVDLGLPSGTLWATSNVNPGFFWELANYYAWGETTNKTGFSWKNYKWSEAGVYTLMKYNTDSTYGATDNKTVLDLEDDAAHANWGGDWRMPTYEEMKELKEKCTWTWMDNYKGFIVTGPNGKNIFLPASGHFQMDIYLAGTVGYYWSGSLNSSNPRSAYYLYFSRSGVYVDSEKRCYGHSVRPVCSPQ